MKKYLIWLLFLVLLWGALNDSFTPLNLLAGAIIALMMLWVVGSSRNFRLDVSLRLTKLLPFLVFIIAELFKANMKIAYIILTPREHSLPGIICFPLQCQKNYQRVWLSNMITLTPGTLTIDISKDYSTLFVHAMFLQDREKLIQELRDLEKRIMELLP